MSSSSLLCSLSGDVAVRPVLNPRSGRVYSSHLIEQHLLTSATDPITNEPLAFSDLIPIHPESLALPPFLSSPSPSSLSLSSLLFSLQSEYDGLMLEQFTLKREVHSLKQELAHALYQYDAACRVIARLMRENEQTKAALLLGRGAAESKDARHDGAAGGEREAMEVEGEQKEGGAVSKLSSVFEETSERLGGKTRKAATKEKANAAAPKENVARYSVTQSFTLHGTTTPGVNALDVDERDGRRMLLSGGLDGSVIILDALQGKIKETLKAHKRKVTNVAFVQPAASSLALSSPSVLLPVLSCSTDPLVQLHAFDNEAQHYVSALSWPEHSAAITAMSLHPSGLYFATGSLDSSYLIYSVEAARPVLRTSTASPLSSVSFHPDGRILMTASHDKLVRMYDALESKCVATLSAHSSLPLSLAFSPNGYHAASGDEGGAVRIWDLRKVSAEQDENSIATITATEGKHVAALSFDDSGSMLAIAVGREVTLLETKGWSEITRWTEHKEDVRALTWGSNARWLATASKDRTVKFWGSQEASA